MSNIHLILVTYNSPKFVELTLKTLGESTSHPFDITIVDNASEVETIDVIKNFKLTKNIGQINNIFLEENIGYGGAINLAYEKRKDYDFVVPINSDLVFSKGWLTKMTLEMEKDRKIGLLGPLSPVQFCKHPYSQKDTRQFMMEIGELEDPKSELDSFIFGKSWDRFVKDLIEDNYSRESLMYFQGPPSHIMGFCYMARSLAIEDAGGLVHPDFFFGGDDTDLSWRMQKKDYKLAVTRNVYIHHFKHRSFRENNVAHAALFKKLSFTFYKKWKSTIEEFLRKEVKSGKNVDKMMKEEDYYDYWVLRRLNDHVKFWNRNKLN
ncbi:MAG TPA: glycosyltransferase [bacterium]|nr:glycosyltransferase [bacterium]